MKPYLEMEKKMSQLRNYIGISRDHSGSMRSIAHVAKNDYNSKIDAIKSAAIANFQDTKVSVVECGYGSTDAVRTVVNNAAVTVLEPMATYTADGRGTPLYDSVGSLIELFEKLPAAKDKDASFVIFAITDGQENSSCYWSDVKLARRITELTATDRWSFIFRVPRGYGRDLQSKLGIPAGNIQEWDQTERGVVVAAKADAEAFTQYFAGRSLGATSTQKFYADLTNVSASEVKAQLEDISSEVMLWPVSEADDGAVIVSFCEQRLSGFGKRMLKGAAFYQLTKPEARVQDYKKILIRDKTTNAIYYGNAAKQMLGLPTVGQIKLWPGQQGNYDVFIQSTSYSRKLVKNSQLLYWENAGLQA
jgi:hypothetical protein